MVKGICEAAPFSCKVRAVVSLGLMVVGTFVMLWSPWLGSWAAARQVLTRLITLSRGIFEDYVANFWCVSNVISSGSSDSASRCWPRLACPPLLLPLLISGT
ncbi:hypothetical protein WJX84_006364 [Apatococcus fuscideae]|uniref:Alpha-1,3-glucosyltransferase n=1 Tax=Apatococcus fuscideae TaxID=2026836 RepID=A0AAW1SMM9_9CHLO